MSQTTNYYGGLGEFTVALFWRLLSPELRERISRYIQSADATAAQVYPSSRTLVYSRLAYHRELFANNFVPDSTQGLLHDDLTKLPPYSLITTCKNEKDSVKNWLQSVVDQSAFPSQLVICDGGSTDGTLETIHDWCAQYNNRAPAHKVLRVTVEQLPGASIAAGRNHAAQLAVNPILLCTDLGCSLHGQWAEFMLIPFWHRPDTEVVCGWYSAICSGMLAENYLRFLVPRLEAINPNSFLPSARSLAVTHSAFKRAGRFPEFLSHAGEDSLFDYYLRWTVYKWAFVPDAIVQWSAPTKLRSLFTTTRRYAQGDGEGGKLFWSHYVWLLRVFGYLAVELSFFVLIAALMLFTGELGLLFILALLLIPIVRRVRGIARPFGPAQIGSKPFLSVIQDWFCLGVFCCAQLVGFLIGVRNRRNVERKRIAAASGTFIICSREPLCLTAELTEKLEEGWFILNLAAEGPRQFDHPHYDLFYYSGIYIETLREKYLATNQELMLSIHTDSGIPETIARTLEEIVCAQEVHSHHPVDRFAIDRSD